MNYLFNTHLKTYLYTKRKKGVASPTFLHLTLNIALIIHNIVILKHEDSTYTCNAPNTWLLRHGKDHPQNHPQGLRTALNSCGGRIGGQ